MGGISFIEDDKISVLVSSIISSVPISEAIEVIEFLGELLLIVLLPEEVVLYHW